MSTPLGPDPGRCSGSAVQADPAPAYAPERGEPPDPGPDKPAFDRPSAEDARIANRLLGELMFRRMMRFRTLFGGSVILSLVAAEILAVNESGPVKAELTRGGGEARGGPKRRPASALSIANALGMPYETVRRHVRKLEQMGFCRRVVGGVEISADVLRRPEFLAEADTAMIELKRLVRDLRSAGVDLG